MGQNEHAHRQGQLKRELVQFSEYMADKTHLIKLHTMSDLVGYLM